MWCKFNEKSHGFLDYFCKDFVRNLEYSYGYHRVENRHSLIVMIVLSIKPWIKHNSTFWSPEQPQRQLLLRNSDYKLKHDMSHLSSFRLVSNTNTNTNNNMNTHTNNNANNDKNTYYNTNYDTN